MNSLLRMALRHNSRTLPNLIQRCMERPAINSCNQMTVIQEITKSRNNFENICKRLYTTITRKDISLIGSEHRLRQTALPMTYIPVRSMSHRMPLTYDFIRERILLLLKLYDKVDPEKLSLDSHFYKDLGLDSLDHVEVIMAIEDEFHIEIPDSDAERLLTPKDVLKYISDKEEAYEGLQKDDHNEHH